MVVNVKNIHCNFISLNVRGIRDSSKRNGIFTWCREKRADVVFLQETYSSKDTEDRWSSNWDGKCLYSHGSSHSKGVLILINAHLDIELKEVIYDSDGRYILVECVIQGLGLILCNVYFPVRGMDKQQTQVLQDLAKKLKSINKEQYPVVIGGDFNMIRNFELDYAGNRRQSRQSRFDIEIEKFIEDWNLIDIWRQRNALKRMFTFRQRDPFMQSRLDYWFISENLEDLITKCQIIPSVSPDHSAIHIEMYDKNPDKVIQRSGYWKFNNSLCDDPVFVEQMKKEIIKLKGELQLEIQDKRVIWDFLKMKIRQFTQNYSKNLSKIRREKIERLEREIQDLEISLTDQPDDGKIRLLDDKKRELKANYDIVIEGVKIRSRASWYERGEKDSRYFTQLLQSNKRKSIIRKILKPNGEISCDEMDILNEIRTFYSNLYADSGTLSNFDLDFFPMNLPRLGDDMKESCEGVIIERECIEVLKEMKFNKSPGNDGLTTEFYVKFWPIISELVIEAFNEAFRCGELSASQKQATITLIAKEGKDPLSIKNYRPISLLNVDYKILSKVLASRIKKVLEEVILPDQMGFMKGRNIGEAIRIIDDMIFHTSHFNLPGFLIAIDFEKAFDSVAHRFLQKVLSSFGFGPSFRRWTEILYTNALSCVLNGGNSTGYFKVEKGVRQGDPLSPYLFILCIEILAHRIRMDDHIRGLHFGKKEVKLVLYADDMTLLLEDVESVRKLEGIFESFRQISGLKLNKEKTKLLFLGCRLNDTTNFPFGQRVNFIKILGVFFALDVNVKENMNYKEILSKIKKLLTWWKQRDLTLMGKIQLLKGFIFSKLIYVASFNPVPRWVYDELDQLAYDFLWRGQHKVKKKVITMDYKQGGLKMMHFRLLINAQRVMWIRRLLCGNQDMKWKQYFNFVTKDLGGNFIFQCNYLPGLLNIPLPLFYKELLQVWINTRGFRFKHEMYKGNEILFNNKLILIDGKSLFDRRLFSRNMYKLEHIMDRQGELRSPFYFYNHGVTEIDIIRIKQFYRALPPSWKENMDWEGTQIDRNVDSTTFIIKGKKVRIDEIKSKNIYEEFLKIETDAPSVLEKIKKVHSIECSVKEIENIFTRPRWCTLNSNLREFQFKLLHGFVYTNFHLSKFGFIQNNLCSFCTRDVETYHHIFYTCESAQSTWEKCSRIFKCDLFQNLSWEEILFGIYLPDKGQGKLINHVIILIKYLLYHFRGRSRPPNESEIKSNIEDDKLEEKKLAVTRNLLPLHLSKWEKLQW